MDVVYGDLASRSLLSLPVFGEGEPAASGGNLSAYIEEAIKDKLRKARRISDVSDPWSRLFRRLFLEYLVKAFDAAKLQFFSSLELLRDRSSFLDYLAPLREAEWVVYAKRPFAGPEQVLDYVGRYTHRVAISNNRLLDIAQDKVTFRYKDYRHDAQQKTMTVEAEEFIRRFLLHVLPEGFQRIRYYGFLANRYREEKLARCRELLDMPAPEPPALEGAKEP
jgi:Putative transposase